MGSGALLGLDVEYRHVGFDRDRRDDIGGVGADDGAGRARVHDVLDANGDACADDLVHGDGVNHLGTVESRLSRLGMRDGFQEAGRGDLSRIGGEDAVDLPDLQLASPEANGSESGADIGVASTDLPQQPPGNFAEKARDDGDHVGVERKILGANDVSKVPVEPIVRCDNGRAEINDPAEVDEDGIGPLGPQEGSHEPAARFLAYADDHVLSLIGDGLD